MGSHRGRDCPKETSFTFLLPLIPICISIVRIANAIRSLDRFSVLGFFSQTDSEPDYSVHKEQYSDENCVLMLGNEISFMGSEIFKVIIGQIPTSHPILSNSTIDVGDLEPLLSLNISLNLAFKDGFSDHP